MDQTKEALDNFLSSIIVAISSQKFWFSLLGMAAAGYIAYTNQGSIEAVIAALLGAIGIPITFVVSKTYQNTHGENAPAVQVAKISTEGVSTSNGSTPVAATSKPIAEEIIYSPRPVSQVKDRVDSVLKTINKETKWEVLFGTFTDTVKRMKKRMLDMHPDWNDMKAVDEVLNQFSGGILSEQDCANVQSYLGLPAVIHAKNDLLILQAMLTAEKEGTLGEEKMKGLLIAAKRYAAKDIVDDAVLRIQHGQGNAESRLALQEFGYSAEEARKAQYSGGYVTGFDPWARAGFDPFGEML